MTEANASTSGAFRASRLSPLLTRPLLAATSSFTRFFIASQLIGAVLLAVVVGTVVLSRHIERSVTWTNLCITCECGQSSTPELPTDLLRRDRIRTIIFPSGLCGRTEWTSTFSQLLLHPERTHLWSPCGVSSSLGLCIPHPANTHEQNHSGRHNAQRSGTLCFKFMTGQRC
jgi:hypothetical protein